MNSGQIVSVNISNEKGTSKHPVERIVIAEQGVENDAHAGHWHRQVSLLGQEDIAAFCHTHSRDIQPGEFAENITTSSIDWSHAALCDQVRAGSALLEVTQFGKRCHGDACAIFLEVGACVMPSKGVFCRVLESGTAAAGDPVRLLPTPLSVHVVTLSDRAAVGIYPDRSGPRIKERLEQHLRQQRWRLAVTAEVLPDNADLLRKTLATARSARTGLLITTGSTGLGPRDIAPEVVGAALNQPWPGIMDHIRANYAQQKPAALLSRGLAGVMGQTLVFTLPGSVRAVDEYLDEILRVLDHALFMIRGIDRHG